MARFRSAGLALAVVAILGLARPTLAGEQVPFKGGFAGVDVGTPLAPPLASAKVTASGNATHLGKCAYVAVVTVNTATGAGSGTFQFSAANGDTVFGTVNGQATFTPPNALSIKEVATITGGTGRFVGATGGFTTTRVKNTMTNATAATFTGTIARGP